MTISPASLLPHSELIPRLAGCDYEQEVERVAPRLMAKEVDVQDAAILVTLPRVWPRNKIPILLHSGRDELDPQ